MARGGEWDADPRQLTTHFQYDIISPLPQPTVPSGPQPTPPVESKCDLARIEAAIVALEKACAALVTEVGASRESADAAKAAAEQARDEAHAVLSKDEPDPPIYVINRLPVVGTITLTPQA